MNADLFYLTTSSIHLSGVLACVDSIKGGISTDAIDICFCFISTNAFFVLLFVGTDYFLNFPSNRIDLHSHKISQYC